VKILFRPRYDESAASSRLRAYALCRAIAGFGLADAMIAQPGKLDPDLAFDVIVNQKTDNIVQGGRLTVYDYDDELTQHLPRAFRDARFLTVDTAKRFNALENIPACPALAVLPDPIDYEPAGPLADPGMTAIAWFGNAGAGNFDSVKWMFDALRGTSTRGIPTVAICEKPLGGFTLSMRWDFAEFPKMLRQCGLAMISHRGADPCKSENKMTAAITLGVPVIIGSGSPACEDLAHACDVGWTVATTKHGVVHIVERLTYPGERALYLKKTQQHVWDTYRAEVVARQAVKYYQERL
jgi:hypothetical protein